MPSPHLLCRAVSRDRRAQALRGRNRSACHFPIACRSRRVPFAVDIPTQTRRRTERGSSKPRALALSSEKPPLGVPQTDRDAPHARRSRLPIPARGSPPSASECTLDTPDASELCSSRHTLGLRVRDEGIARGSEGARLRGHTTGRPVPEDRTGSLWRRTATRPQRIAIRLPRGRAARQPLPG